MEESCLLVGVGKMPRSKRSSKTTFLILCCSGFFDWMSYGLVFPIFASMIYDDNGAFFALHPHASLGLWLGILVAASPLAQFFSSPFVGAFSDRAGRRPVLQICSLIIITGYIISALGVREHHLSTLILGRIVTGIGAGNIVALNSAASDITESSSKAKKFALIMMTNAIGLTLGPFLGGQLSILGFEIPFISAGCLTLLNFFLITFALPETHVKMTHKYSTFIPQLYRDIKEIHLRKFRVLYPAFFIFCFGWAFYWSFIPITWIKSYGLNVTQIGDFYSYASVCYVISSGLLIRPIIRRFGGLSILFISLISLATFLAILIPMGLMSYWFYIPIQQFLVALIFPVGTAVVSNLALPTQQGETLGTFQSLQACAFALTPFLGGAVLDFSDNSPLIVGSIALFLAGTVLLIGYRKKLFKRL